jgi:hypothetical protein
MLTLLRLQHRRLFAVWLAVIAFLLAQVACGCMMPIPEGLPISALVIGFSRLFLLTLVPVAITFVLIWLMPALRCIIDIILPVALLVPALKIAESTLGLSNAAGDVIGLGLLFVMLLFFFGVSVFGRRLWFAYQGTGNVVLRGTPEELWPRLVLNEGAVQQHVAPNLLSVTRDPADPTRRQARYAMQKGTVLTMDFTNVRDDPAVSFSCDHTGDSPLLKGALATGSFGLELTRLGLSSTRMRIHVATGPLPPLVVLTLWLDNLAQDQAQMAMEAITGKGDYSLYRRTTRGFMKAYRKKHPA